MGPLRLTKQMTTTCSESERLGMGRQRRRWNQTATQVLPGREDLPMPTRVQRTTHPRLADWGEEVIEVRWPSCHFHAM